jgi:hypothetical protein
VTILLRCGGPHVTPSTYFYQDGAPLPFSCTLRQWLDQFSCLDGESALGDVAWPSPYPDLTSMGKSVLRDSRPRSTAALLPFAQPLPERCCDVCTSLWRRIHSVSCKTGTSLNIAAVNAQAVLVFHTYVFVWTCNILPQLATLQRYFRTSTLKPSRFVRYSCCMLWISLFHYRFLLPWKHSHIFATPP